MKKTCSFKKQQPPTVHETNFPQRSQATRKGDALPFPALSRFGRMGRTFIEPFEIKWEKEKRIRLLRRAIKWALLKVRWQKDHLEGFPLREG
jgi:hypothetical protein